MSETQQLMDIAERCQSIINSYLCEKELMNDEQKCQLISTMQDSVHSLMIGLIQEKTMRCEALELNVSMLLNENTRYAKLVEKQHKDLKKAEEYIDYLKTMVPASRWAMPPKVDLPELKTKTKKKPTTITTISSKKKEEE